MKASAGHCRWRHVAGLWRAFSMRGCGVSEALARARRRPRHRPRVTRTSGDERHARADATLRRGARGDGRRRHGRGAARRRLRAIDDARDAQRIAPLVVLRENAAPWTAPHAAACRAAAPLGWRVTAERRRGVLTSGSVARRAARSADARRRRNASASTSPAAALPPGYHRLELLVGTELAGAHALCGRARACYRRHRRRRAGPGAPPLQLYARALRAQLGHRRFHRPRDAGRAMGRARRGHRRRQSAACAVPARCPPREPLQPVEPAFPQHAVSSTSRPSPICATARPRGRWCSPRRFRNGSPRCAPHPLVDYAGVAAAKRPVLELLYRHFRARYLAAGDARARGVPRVRQRGAARRCAAMRCSMRLQEHLHRADPSDLGLARVARTLSRSARTRRARFAADHAERVEFSSLPAMAGRAAVRGRGRRARSRRPRHRPLYRSRRLHRSRRRRGLGEPGPLRTRRQRRRAARRVQHERAGLGPAADRCPAGSRAAAYAPFLAMVRANMRNAGALRIDHVMGLARLFWVPAGMAPARRRLRRLPVRRSRSAYSRSKAIATAAS